MSGAGRRRVFALAGCLSLAAGCRTGTGDQVAVAGVAASIAGRAAMVPCDSLARLVATAAHLSPAAAGLVRASLRRHEGTVVRWPDGASIDVWLQPYDAGCQHRPGDDAFADVVRHAVRDWDAARAGIRLHIVADSAPASVHVLWTTRLAPSDTTAHRMVDGRSAVGRNATSGAVEEADVILGQLDARGVARTPADVHAIAVHEIGHVLGLSHAGSRVGSAGASVMAARVTADEVTADDHRALRAWYALPVGLRCMEAPDDSATTSRPRAP